MQYLDYICVGVCVLCSVIHFVIGIINSKLQGKKLERICEKCLSPVYSGDDHKCLNEFQLSKLVDFVSSLRGDNDV